MSGCANDHKSIIYDSFYIAPKERLKLEQKAANGDVEACFRLSRYYWFSSRNYSLSEQWMRRAAEHGYPPAQRELAFILLMGPRPVKMDEAIYWLTEAISRGDEGAKKTLRDLETQKFYPASTPVKANK